MHPPQCRKTISQSVTDGGNQRTIFERYLRRIAYSRKTDCSYRRKHCILKYFYQNFHFLQNIFMFIIMKASVNPAAIQPVSTIACIVRLKKHR